jgi:flavin-dependent dehydrogenase
VKVVISAKEVDIREQVDVLVVGGGPAGLGAAVSAARTGARVLLLERRAFLGGNITSAYVETCNWFLNGTRFRRRLVQGDRGRVQGPRRTQPRDPRLRPVPLLRGIPQDFLDEFLAKEQVRVWFYSFVNDVVLEGDHLKAVIVQTKKGPVAVSAKVVVDATGDGDVAFAAGIPSSRAATGTGTASRGRSTSASPEWIRNASPRAQGEGRFKAIDREFQRKYDAGEIALDCKRGR